MDIYTIIFLALAVFIFLRLRSVLGQRTGSERPPYDRAARDVVQGRAGDAGRGDNVVPMPPGAIIDQAPLAPSDPTPALSAGREPRSPAPSLPAAWTGSPSRIRRSIRNISWPAPRVPTR